MISIFIIPKELLLDMKYANYGVPMFSFIISVAVVFTLMLFSQMLSGKMKIGGGKIISILGICSMEIMYIHQFIRLRILGALPSFVVFVMCIALPITFHYLVIKNKHLSILFIGK